MHVDDVFGGKYIAPYLQLYGIVQVISGCIASSVSMGYSTSFQN